METWIVVGLKGFSWDDLLTSSEVELMETLLVWGLQKTNPLLTSSEVELMETLVVWSEQTTNFASDFLGS